MTRTVHRKIGSKRFSARARRSTMISLASFESMLARIDLASARLKASRRKAR